MPRELFELQVDLSYIFNLSLLNNPYFSGLFKAVILFSVILNEVKNLSNLTKRLEIDSSLHCVPLRMTIIRRFHSATTYFYVLIILFKSESTIRYQPSTNINNSTLSGSDINCGGNKNIPSDIKILDITMSKTKNGMKIRNPI